MSSEALAGLMIVAAIAPALAVEVRVRDTAGGPQIHVDGVAVPPRMYFGNRGSGGIDVAEEWTECGFTISPQIDAPGNGTLHFRFGHAAGQVELADLRVVDAATGADVVAPGSLASQAAFEAAWHVWPPDERNTVGKLAAGDGVLKVDLAEPPGGNWPDFHLYHDVRLRFERGHTYRVSFRARANPARRINPGVYRVANGAFTPLETDLEVFFPQIELARDAGVRFISFPMDNGWAPPGTADPWNAVDSICEQIIAHHPTVLLLPRIGMEPPPWFTQQHPDARMQYENGRRGPTSISYRPYREAACAQLERLCAHLTERFPDHFAGIHPCGQNTGEWFYEATWEPFLSGYDPPTREAWRAWLAARGLPDADIPSPADRHAHARGLLRDPAAERLLIEFNRFQQHEMATFVREMAAAARRGSQGRKLVVFFYGYHYEFGAVPTGAPVSGHYGLTEILDDAEVDIFCSPISYGDRQWQGASSSMAPAESVNLAGKLWLNEDDTRTYLSGTTDYGGISLPGRVEGQRASRAVLLRNTAQAALRGFGTWWMDLPGEGWFNDRALWDELVRMRPLDNLMVRRTQRYAPPIAVVTHEDSICHLAGGSHPLARPLIYESRMAFGRCGASYGQYLLRDVAAGRVPAKLQVMLTAWALSPAEREALAANRAEGTTRVWCGAPGYLGADRADTAAMDQLTGFRHRLVKPATLVVTPTDRGRELGLTEPWGSNEPLEPLFSAEAPAADVLATYADGSAAIAVRQGPRGPDIFCGTPHLTSPLVRAFCRLAGVHLFCQRDIALWEADGILSIHTMHTGPLTIDTGVAQPAIDLLEGAVIGQGPLVTLPVTAGETVVIRYR